MMIQVEPMVELCTSVNHNNVRQTKYIYSVYI